MNKYKLLRFLLCFSLVLCVGYLTVGNYHVSAYSVENMEFQPITWPYTPWVEMYDSNLTSIFSSMEDGRVTFQQDNNSYEINDNLSGSQYIDGVYDLKFGGTYQAMDIVLAPNLYDYYFMFTVYGYSNLTLVPDYVYLMTDNCNSPVEYNLLQDLQYYHYDNIDNIGYTVIGRMPVLDNTNITDVLFRDESTGRIPKRWFFNGAVISIPKGGDSEVFMSAILGALEQIDNNTDRLETLTESIIDIIESQYNIPEDGDLGIEDNLSQITDSMGLLDFASDCLHGFIECFNEYTVATVDDSGGKTLNITFPAFNIDVQGQTYTVWEAKNFNLYVIEDAFPVLMKAVRFATVLLCWFGLFSYIIHVKDRIIGY